MRTHVPHALDPTTRRRAHRSRRGDAAPGRQRASCGAQLGAHSSPPSAAAAAPRRAAARREPAHTAHLHVAGLAPRRRAAGARRDALTPHRNDDEPRTLARRGSYERTGGVLLSQALAGQVPSALRGLTALFGMGRGVSPSLSPPKSRETEPSPELENRTADRRTRAEAPARHRRSKIRQALEPLVPVC
jgi:hypothetical protein